jgi:hypothetical protein
MGLTTVGLLLAGSAVCEHAQMAGARAGQAKAEIAQDDGRGVVDVK